MLLESQLLSDTLSILFGIWPTPNTKSLKFSKHETLEISWGLSSLIFGISCFMVSSQPEPLFLWTGLCKRFKTTRPSWKARHTRSSMWEMVLWDRSKSFKVSNFKKCLAVVKWLCEAYNSLSFGKLWLVTDKSVNLLFEIFKHCKFKRWTVLSYSLRSLVYLRSDIFKITKLETFDSPDILKSHWNYEKVAVLKLAYCIWSQQFYSNSLISQYSGAWVCILDKSNKTDSSFSTIFVISFFTSSSAASYFLLAVIEGFSISYSSYWILLILLS